MTLRRFGFAAFVLVLGAAPAFAQTPPATAPVYNAVVLPVEEERRRALEHATAARAYNARYDRAYATYAGQSGASGDLRRVRCADAKAHRDATLGEVGLGRTFDLLRALDDAVYEACKGL